ncbi:hypothetical protein EAH68_06050 [Corynebacterium hylobatis]|uniref:DUF3558 domain-containing protein n=1 Tax=Corynebacterium hylobatis TaxID=1859290 RepID=A0A430HZI6_9CORY|nr:LppP/LprE family lipoprotein [Corynebacterium hylobatis]RSZ63797.1 hypothetical protein EAH68_06050 [Corynebacterium hylobatis]
MRIRLFTAALLGTALTLTACASDSGTDTGTGADGEATACGDVTVEDTAFAPYLDLATIPTDVDLDMQEVQIREDHFDACQLLSWLIVDGTLGADPAFGVVFFHEGELVRDTSVLAGDIAASTRVSETAVSVDYPSGDDTWTVEHAWENGRMMLSAGDVPEFTTDVLRGAHLDLLRAPGQ